MVSSLLIPSSSPDSFPLTDTIDSLDESRKVISQNTHGWRQARGMMGRGHLTVKGKSNIPTCHGLDFMGANFILRLYNQSGLSELRRVRGVVGIGEGVCRPAVRPTITQPVRSSDAVAVCLLATGRWQLKRSVRKSQRAMSAFLGPRCNKSLRQVPHRARQAQPENGAQMLRGTARKRSI
ncbi:hypothetical protein Bbelb_267440 [Branchiostoma belcheri]|nr:hypothetical protein Bbelb_267440 [Branchiostoma belcheri]